MSMHIFNYPKCPKCDKGEMLPVEDSSYAAIAGTQAVCFLKGWACSNPDCDNNIWNDKGTLTRQVIGAPVRYK